MKPSQYPFDHDKHAHGHTLCIIKPSIWSSCCHIDRNDKFSTNGPSPLFPVWNATPAKCGLHSTHTCTLYIAGQNIALSWDTWSPFKILMNLGDGWSWHELVNTGSVWSSNPLQLDDMVHGYTVFSVMWLCPMPLRQVLECNPLT